MKKLNTLLIATILICLIISISISTYYSTMVSKEAIEAESQESLHALAIQSANKLDQLLMSYSQQFELLKDVIENQSVIANVSLEHRDILFFIDQYKTSLFNFNMDNPTVTATYFVLNPEVFPYIKNSDYPYQVLYVKNETGKVIQSNNLANQDNFNSTEDYMSWYTGPLNSKKGVWSNIYYDEFLEKRILTYSTPIIVNDAVIAIIGVDISFSNFEKIIDEIKVYQTGYAFLMNSNFDYLVHPTLGTDENLMTIYNGRYAYMAEIFNDNQSGIIKYYFDNKDKIMAYTHLENGWIVATAPPYSEFFLTYNKLKNKQINFIIIGVLVSIVIAIIVSFYISAPLSKLAKEINRVSEDNLEPPIPSKNYNRFSEINILFNNHTDMRRRLKEAFMEIQKHNHSLEALIEIRTLALTVSNSKLIQSLEDLKATQDQLVYIQKQEEINLLIKNIVHSINTPLGNAITTYSFEAGILAAINKELPLVKKHKDGLIQSSKIITSSLNSMKNIIDGLTFLSTDFDRREKINLNLKTAIDSRFAWSMSHHMEVDLSLNLNSDVDNIRTYKKMFLKMIDKLFLRSILNTDESRKLHINIDIIRENDYLIMKYMDELEIKEEVLTFFDANNISSLNISNFNFDLIILKAIISEGLNGSVNLKPIGSQMYEWNIKIPI